MFVRRCSKENLNHFCLLCWETMRKMFLLLSFGFHKIPYKSEIIENYLSKNNETGRADSLSDKDSESINCVGGMP